MSKKYNQRTITIVTKEVNELLDIIPKRKRSAFIEFLIIYKCDKEFVDFFFNSLDISNYFYNAKTVIETKKI